MRVWANDPVLCVLSLVLAGAACDTTPRGRDAAAQSGQRIAEVSVRLDAPNGGTPSASVLAFRASVTGVSPDEVLPAVDPLVVAQPTEGACVLRDVAGPARALGAQGGRVELEALEGLTVELGQSGRALDERLELTGGSVLRPTPRVYPNLPSVVGGVWAEAGPVDLAAAPTVVSLSDSAGGRFGVPAMPRLGIFASGTHGETAPMPARLTATSDLHLSVAGPARTFVELRPFGATWALACPTTTAPGGLSGATDRAVVPASWLGRLAELKVPVRVEAVARESHPAVTSGGTSVRLTLEVRSWAEIELVP
jgi:hypothetical protein